eukprot:UN08425
MYFECEGIPPQMCNLQMTRVTLCSQLSALEVIKCIEGQCVGLT